MDEPVVKYVTRRRPGREVPGSFQEPYTLSEPNDFIIQFDTNIYLHEIECAEGISERYPGKVWIAPNMLIELEKFKGMSPKKREEKGIHIDDFGSHMARIHDISSPLGGEPFRFPTFLEMKSNYGEKGMEAAKAIEAAANCSYVGKSGNGKPNCADMGLFVAPVLANGDEFDGKRYSWLILSNDRGVKSAGKNLRNDGYQLVTVGDVEALDYHASKFL